MRRKRQIISQEQKAGKAPQVRVPTIIRLQKNAVYFAGEWYLAINQNGADAEIDTLMHFLRYGMMYKKRDIVILTLMLRCYPEM